MAEFQITSGEVLEVLYGDSNPNLIYGIKVKPLDGTPSDDETSLSVITAKPLNTSILRIPIKGEVVLLLQAPSSYASGNSSTSDTYYFDIVSLQSSIHHNALPTISSRKVQTSQTSGDSDKYNETNSGNTNTQEEPKIDENFSENPTVKPLQPYVGDLLIEGRYGNSIRFSTTPKSGKFTVAPKWSGGSESAPITIFRNSKQGTDTQKINDYITEDFTNNENIMVMASGQNIEFEQGSGVVTAIQSKSITSWKDENWGTTPQTLISSGRLVFNSSQKEIIAFAKNGIGLSSETNIAIDAKNIVAINATKIELGDEANEPLILGNKFKTWAETLIDRLSTLTVITPAGPSSPLSASPQWASISTLKAELTNLLSDLSFTKKSTSTSSGNSSKIVSPSDFKMTTEDKKEVQQIVDKEKTAAAEVLPEEEKWIRIAREEYVELKESEVKAEEFVHVSAEDVIDEVAAELAIEAEFKNTAYIPDNAQKPSQSNTDTTDPTNPTDGQPKPAPDNYVTAAIASWSNPDIPNKIRYRFVGAVNERTKADLEKKLTLAKEMYDYMTLEKGWGDYQARGLLANAVRETQLIVGQSNPDAGNNKQDGGLWQWNGERYLKMTKAVTDWKTNWKGQIDYIIEENYKNYPRKYFLGEYDDPTNDGRGYITIESGEDAAEEWRRVWEVSRNTNGIDDDLNNGFIKYLFPPGLTFKNAPVKSTPITEITSADAKAGFEAAIAATSDYGETALPVGTNFGGKVTEYLASAGITKPAKWAAAACNYWWKTNGLPTPGEGRGGSVQGWWEWAKETGRDSQTPLVGAIAIYAAEGSICHCGIVTGIKENGTITTIEGNTSIPEEGIANDGVDLKYPNKGTTTNGIVGYVIPKK